MMYFLLFWYLPGLVFIPLMYKLHGDVFTNKDLLKTLVGAVFGWGIILIITAFWLRDYLDDYDFWNKRIF